MENYKITIEKTNANGEVTTIDVTAIETFIPNLEKEYRETGKIDTTSRVSLIKSFNKDQLEMLVWPLICSYVEKLRLIDFFYTDKGQEHVEQIREMKKLAKDVNLPLWPSLDDYSL